MKIGLLSDTHGWLDSKILDFFKDCDEVWHCGDIGDLAVTDRLAANFNLRAVYGNIDGGEIRTMFAPALIFDCEGVKTVMTHIGDIMTPEYGRYCTTNARSCLSAAILIS